jgi:shikimate kinase
MVILLFGITNVGKSVTGEKLAERLNYTFYDLDEVIKEKLQTTLEQFMKDHPFSYERGKLKGKILSDIVSESTEDIVVAVSPIFYSRFFNRLLDLDQVIAFELQDSEENIFQRLVFSDEEDNLYTDDDYKEQNREYYIKDIHEDIMYAKKLFRKIKNKYFINNKPVDEVVDGLIDMLHDVFENAALDPSETGNATE